MCMFPDRNNLKLLVVLLELDTIYDPEVLALDVCRKQTISVGFSRLNTLLIEFRRIPGQLPYSFHITRTASPQRTGSPDGPLPY